MSQPRFADFSFLEVKGDVANFLEMRMENDADGNPIYVGYTKKPQTGTDIPAWFIVKVDYDGNESPVYQQLPNRGLSFDYIWDDRADYFL